MKNLFILLLLSLIISACTLKKVENLHGTPYLNKKQEMLVVNSSNKNDIIKLLGAPSTKSAYNDNLWIYIERKTKNSSLVNFGKKKITVNNVLLLEINNKGLLVSKEHLDINDMNSYEFTKLTTENKYEKNTFIYDFLKTLRQKINDPLGKKTRR